MELLCANPSLIQAQIGITTLDEGITTMFEPCAAPPAQRLQQIEILRAAGVKLRARLDPLIPGWTDEREALDELCGALAAAGVSEMSASALFVRPEIVRALKHLLPDQSVLHTLLQHYPPLCTGRSVAGRKGERSLPKATRERMYESVKEIAVRHGIVVSICGCENPDITSERCHIAGDWPDARTDSRQTNLFAVEPGET
jgi:DNA repair photolyase